MNCSECGVQIKVTSKKRDLFVQDSCAFCSEKCLRRHIEALEPVEKDFLEEIGIRDSLQSWGNRDCYSRFLGVSFRSWFECDVAEFLVRNWKTQIFYEAHILPVSNDHFYIPDFWLPSYGAWLEVKGEWRFGAKTKFSKAQEILGKDRLILVPDSYKSWFKRGKKIWW